MILFYCLWCLPLLANYTRSYVTPHHYKLHESRDLISPLLLPSWTLPVVPGPSRDSIRHAEWANDSCGNKIDMTWKTTDAEQGGKRGMVSMVSGRMFSVQPDLFPTLSTYFPLHLYIFKRWYFLYNDSLLFIMYTLFCFMVLVKVLAMKFVFHFACEWFQRRRPFPSTINKLSGP